jgi:Uma2 family endonuclease
MVGVTTLPRGRAYTRADLERMPDDGRRHEIVDGTLVVTPAPSARHQIVVVNLLVALKASCPSELQVLTAPFDVALTADTIVQPDVLIARRSELTERDLAGPPVLAVEVLSASTRRIDLTLKRVRYEAAGCPAYWAVDPDQPSITAWQLERGVYAEAGHATGDQPLEVTSPFRLSLTPARLLG